MVDKVQVAAGTLLKLHDGATPGTFATVAEVETIGEISQTKPEVKATPLNADAERYIPGLKDGDTTEIQLFYLGDDPTQDDATGIKKVFDAGDTRKYAVCPPVGYAKEIQFEAIITKHSVGPFGPNDAIRRKITIRLVSDPVLVANTNV